MDTTCTTLIRRVIDGEDPAAWGEFYRLYSGLIYRYARGRGLNDTDAADIVGECMAALSGRMREFQYDPGRCKFRTFLRVMVSKKVAGLLRKKKPVQADTACIQGLQDGDGGPDAHWEKQWEISHLLFCWARVEREVSPIHAEAFRLFVIHELPAKEVARRLGLEPNHIYQIKSRMTQRLREVMLDMTGESPRADLV
jgi:RNA polymerase sigma factor (sigma-70 family)